jgi:hypothetical protein
MNRAVHLLLDLSRLLPPYVGGLRARLSLETTGDPRSATSAAPKGCVGQGMGSMPMSPCVQPVPAENAPTASTTAQGIVTRMGQDLQGLGGAAIEPGPAGMRSACASFSAACTADLCASARGRSAGAGARAGQAPTIPDGNHGDNQKEATE